MLVGVRAPQRDTDGVGQRVWVQLQKTYYTGPYVRVYGVSQVVPHTSHVMYYTLHVIPIDYTVLQVVVQHVADPTFYITGYMLSGIMLFIYYHVAGFGVRGDVSDSALRQRGSEARPPKEPVSATIYDPVLIDK